MRCVFNWIYIVQMLTSYFCMWQEIKVVCEFANLVFAHTASRLDMLCIQRCFSADLVVTSGYLSSCCLFYDRPSVRPFWPLTPDPPRHQQSIFLHTATVWCFLFLGLWTLEMVCAWKIPVDQQFAKNSLLPVWHQQPCSEYLKSPFVSILMLSLYFGKSFPPSCVSKCATRLVD